MIPGINYPWTVFDGRPNYGCDFGRNIWHSYTGVTTHIDDVRADFAAEWDDPAYGLDFVQVHSYPDLRHPDRDVGLFGRIAASFGLSKPLLIGEHPASPRLHPADRLPPAYWLEDYQALAREGGYLGAWPWSFKGIDAFGAVDRDVMRMLRRPAPSESR